MPDSRLYLGLMSGTSADAVDITAVDFSDNIPQLVAAETTPIELSLRKAIHAIALPGDNEIDRMGELDQELGRFFAHAIDDFLSKHPINRSDVIAIGSHGQTIRHRPPGTLKHPFTLQIGDPNVIAQVTGINTVADFRRRDIAAGGQGAPLVPAFHQSVFHSATTNRAVVNIGGMANISWIPTQGNILGFDTGPGNVLLDGWIQRHRQKNYDADGAWAKSGAVNDGLLAQLLEHPFFIQPYPKSTGREAFNLDWLDTEISLFLKRIGTNSIKNEDVQATLTELTAASIANDIVNLQTQQTSTDAYEVFVCGGGAFNSYLMARLQARLPDLPVATTAALGVEPQWVEAMAFAWLAKQTMERKPGNLTAVTGAKAPVILGGVYFA